MSKPYKAKVGDLNDDWFEALTFDQLFPAGDAWLGARPSTQHSATM